MNMITHKELTSSLNYNPETGIFTWKIASGSASIGKVAGFKTNSQADYLSIRINGKSYLCHRLAWFYMKGCWPKGLIDHINGVKNDNRISNLREVTRGQNKTNSVSSSNTGIKGVHLLKGKNTYKVMFKLKGKSICLGYTDDIELAELMSIAFREKYHGEFACFR